MGGTLFSQLFILKHFKKIIMQKYYFFMKLHWCWLLASWANPWKSNQTEAEKKREERKIARERRKKEIENLEKQNKNLNSILKQTEQENK